MPTGYTSYIQDENISFEKFVLLCARQFGACITMREESMDTPIPEKFEPSNYHLKRIDEIKKELDEIDNITLEEAEKRAAKERSNQFKLYQEYIKKQNVFRQRLTKMLIECEKWIPPSSDHVELKKFMINQINETIKWDCNSEYWQKEIPILSGEAWLNETRKKLFRDLEYHSKANEDEIAATNKRNVWLKQLRESLNPSTSP